MTTIKDRILFSDCILEKHYKSAIHRSICDYFFDAQKLASQTGEEVPPVCIFT